MSITGFHFEYIRNMGVVYSYFSADHEKRIQSLEKSVQNLEKIVLEQNKQIANAREMKLYLEEQKRMFQWDGSTCLYDPKKVLDLQIYNIPFENLEKEMSGFADTETFMKHKGLATQENLKAYIDSKMRWTFNVHYGPLYYTRTFDNKAEADDFRERFSKWCGTRF